MGISRSSPPEVFLGKDALKRCSKFSREHLCGSVISIKLQLATPEGCFWIRRKRYSAANGMFTSNSQLSYIYE